MGSLAISVMTIFPAMIEDFTGYGIVRRAIGKNLLDVRAVDIRDAAEDRHRTVDDTPYGGGAGMVMKPDILERCLESIVPADRNERPPVLYLTPQGRRFDQSEANRLSMEDEIVLVCGRYRGIDERFRERCVTDEISIGDYVLSGGEVAAMVVIDALSRLIPGVMSDFESGLGDSFQDGLLDCPWYTRPEEFRGMRVPDVLLGGNHKEIAEWRKRKSMERTKDRRPDLLDGAVDGNE